MIKIEELKELTKLPEEEIIYCKEEKKIYIFNIKFYHMKKLHQVFEEEKKSNTIQGFSFGTNLIRVNE